MTFYPEKKDNTKIAFAAGLGLGVAAAAAGVYAWKKFKETHPDFSLKDYCEKCGIMSDECDLSYCTDNCEDCACTEPEYEADCDIEDVEVDMTTDDDEDSESDDEDSDGQSLIGSNKISCKKNNVISFESAKSKVLQLAKKLYGKSDICTEGTADNVLLTNDGKSRKCYMFWIEQSGDDTTPLAVFYFDILTGEVFDNSDRGMKKISE